MQPLRASARTRNVGNSPTTSPLRCPVAPERYCLLSEMYGRRPRDHARLWAGDREQPLQTLAGPRCLIANRPYSMSAVVVMDLHLAAMAMPPEVFVILFSVSAAATRFPVAAVIPTVAMGNAEMPCTYLTGRKKHSAEHQHGECDKPRSCSEHDRLLLPIERAIQPPGPERSPNNALPFAFCASPPR